MVEKKMPDQFLPELPGEKSSRLTRRRVLGGLVTGTGGLLVANAISNELRKQGERRVDTPYGFFTGIYEFHEEGYRLDQIPQDIDVLLREYNAPYQPTLKEPGKFLTGNFQDSQEQPRVFPDDVLLMLAKNQIPIMLGDNAIDYNRWFRTYMGELIAGPLAIYDGVSMVKQSDKAPNATRRRLLQAGGTALVAAGLWGSTRLLDILGTPVKKVENDTARRILSRVTNAYGFIHPEDESTFFRNAMIANKLINVAKTIKEKSGVKPHIGYIMGFGHTELEDFLRAGPDFCRSVITAYPDWFLKDMVERNGGIHPFSSAALYRLPQNLTVEDLHNPDKPIDGQTKIITDTKLESALQARLQ